MPEPQQDFVAAVLNNTPGYESDVFETYSTRLLAYARTRLPKQLSSRVDSDDIVQSVFRSFFRRNENGEFSFVEALDVWRLLIAMTYRKVLKSVEHHQRQRRDVHKEIHAGDDPEAQHPHLDIQPGPEQITIMMDYLNWILDRLPESNRAIFQRRMEGHSIAEIADEQKVSQRTVKRVMFQVRRIISEQMVHEDH